MLRIAVRKLNFASFHRRDRQDEFRAAAGDVADEAVDDDGDAGGVADVGDAGVEVDAGRVTAGDPDGDAVKIAPEGAGDDVDEVVGAAASMIGSEGMSMK